MEEENSAQGAPPGSVARHPTGFRRLTPGLLKVNRTADGFDGLPAGVTSPGQLLAALGAQIFKVGRAQELAAELLGSKVGSSRWVSAATRAASSAGPAPA